MKDVSDLSIFTISLSNSKSSFIIILIAGAFFGFNSFLTTNEVDNWCKDYNVLEGYYLGADVETRSGMDDSTRRTIISETNTERGQYSSQVDHEYFAIKSEDKIWKFRAALSRKDISYENVEVERMNANFQERIDETRSKFTSTEINDSDIKVDKLKDTFYLGLNEDTNVSSAKEELKNILSNNKGWPLSVDVYC